MSEIPKKLKTNKTVSLEKFFLMSLSNHQMVKFGKKFLRVRLLETGTFPAARTLLHRSRGSSTSMMGARLGDHSVYCASDLAQAGPDTGFSPVLLARALESRLSTRTLSSSDQA